MLAGARAARGGARVASGGLDPHPHPHPLLVGGGGVDFAGPLKIPYGPGRIRGLLDGHFGPHPVCRRNYKGSPRHRGPVRHALRMSNYSGNKSTLILPLLSISNADERRQKMYQTNEYFHS